MKKTGYRLVVMLSMLSGWCHGNELGKRVAQGARCQESSKGCRSEPEGNPSQREPFYDNKKVGATVERKPGRDALSCSLAVLSFLGISVDTVGDD